MDKYVVRIDTMLEVEGDSAFDALQAAKKKFKLDDCMVDIYKVPDKLGDGINMLTPVVAKGVIVGGPAVKIQQDATTILGDEPLVVTQNVELPEGFPANIDGTYRYAFPQLLGLHQSRLGYLHCMHKVRIADPCTRCGAYGDKKPWYTKEGLETMTDTGGRKLENGSEAELMAIANGGTCIEITQHAPSKDYGIKTKE